MPAGFPGQPGLAMLGGIPLLFPFAGRIRGSSFNWRGKSYSQRFLDERNNSIHGQVFDQPWRVLAYTSSSISGEIQPGSDVVARGIPWPSDYRVRATYAVSSNGLCCDLEILNSGTESLPFSLGFHPYFRMPDQGNSTSIHLPVTGRWVLENMLPTGAFTDPPSGLDCQRGMRLGTNHFDDVFNVSPTADGCLESSVIHLSGKFTIRLRACPGFNHAVVYTPAHRQAVCVEPLTAVPNAHELSERGIGAGMQELEPGEQAIFRLELSVSPLDAGKEEQ